MLFDISFSLAEANIEATSQRKKSLLASSKIMASLAYFLHPESYSSLEVGK